ncbi:unnamed protein product [Dicrocoelium dendriticum]|nr:unnamed protein product [Dicrocoelium dendriticum]
MQRKKHIILVIFALLLLSNDSSCNHRAEDATNTKILSTLSNTSTTIRSRKHMHGSFVSSSTPVDALESIYLPPSMRAAMQVSNAMDLMRFTVCPGNRTEWVNGVMRTFTHYLCPNNLEHPERRYCCIDLRIGISYCCSLSANATVVIVLGLLLGIQTILGALLLLYYYYRHRRKTKSSPSHTTTADTRTREPDHAGTVYPVNQPGPVSKSKLNAGRMEKRSELDNPQWQPTQSISSINAAPPPYVVEGAGTAMYPPLPPYMQGPEEQNR